MVVINSFSAINFLLSLYKPLDPAKAVQADIAFDAPQSTPPTKISWPRRFATVDHRHYDDGGEAN
jgi:hypothetical protein